MVMNIRFCSSDGFIRQVHCV